jgi:hypothetical protein
VSARRLTEKVTVEREITGVIRDLVMFVRYLEDSGLDIEVAIDDAELVRHARDYWEREHGE